MGVFINLPIGLVAIALIIKELEFNGSVESYRTDWFGMLFLAIFLVILQMTLDQGHSKDGLNQIQ